MQQSTIFVEIISNRCYGRSVKSKKPKQKTCPLCRNRYCLANQAVNDMMEGKVKFEMPADAGLFRPFPQPDRIATARQRAEALLQKVTQ